MKDTKLEVTSNSYEKLETKLTKLYARMASDIVDATGINIFDADIEDDETSNMINLVVTYTKDTFELYKLAKKQQLDLARVDDDRWEILERKLNYLSDKTDKILEKLEKLDKA